MFSKFKFLKIKTVFRKWKQEMKTENENTNQTHPNLFSPIQQAS